MQCFEKLPTILILFASIFFAGIISGQETSSTRSPHHHRKHRTNGTRFGNGTSIELADKDKYDASVNSTADVAEYEDYGYEDDDYDNNTTDVPDEEENKFIDSGEGIVSDHVDFVLLRLKHISMKTSSNITEILDVQKEEFKVNSLYQSGWERATKLFNETQREKIFNNTSPDSIVQKVPEEYHIAILSYTLSSLYGEFNKDTREICSGQDIDKYQWKSYFKLLQLAIETLGTQEERWRDNKRFLYRGASRTYKLQEGQVLAFQHFISTSVELTVAENFAGKALFEFEGLYNGTAMAIWDHSYFEHEQEVLFSPLQVFRVDSIHVGNHYTRYVLVKHNVPLPCDDNPQPQTTPGNSQFRSGAALPGSPGAVEIILVAYVLSLVNERL